MRDIPIIFSARMVQALLAGRKTMTRRLLYSVRKEKNGLIRSPMFLRDHPPPHFQTVNPGQYYTLSGWQKAKAGDRLWVRENIYVEGGHDGNGFGYGADLDPQHAAPKLTPCIHMPRHLNRLTLAVTATKIERLQQISEADARAEGFPVRPEISKDPAVHRDAARDWFEDLWISLHGLESWRLNPEVVCLSFQVHKVNIDKMEKAA